MDALRPSKYVDMSQTRRFLGLDEEIAWETRGIPTRNMPGLKTLSDLDALIFVIKDYTTVVISVEEISLFNAANLEAVRFRFPRTFYFSENLEEKVLRKQHAERLKVLRAIVAPAATGSSTLTTVSFIPGEVDHVETSLLPVLRECWRKELSEFCATLHQNPNLRNLHISTKLSEGEGFNIDQLLNSSLEEISLPELREQGWRDLALGLATNRTLRVLTLIWDAEGMETFVQTRVSAEYEISDLTWSMCNRTLETLVIACPSEFDLQADSESLASMLLKVSCVSTFVFEYYPLEPAAKLTRLANCVRQALMDSRNVQALHLHIPFHAKDIGLILKPLLRGEDNSSPANTTLTSLVLVPDRWTKADLDAVGNMLRSNNTITQFGIRHLNPKKKLSVWNCLQHIRKSHIVEFLGRLCENSTLRTLSLRGWSVIDGKDVLNAVLGLLRIQKALDIDLIGTGLAAKNMLEHVDAQLQKNRASEVRHGSARCGSRAGSSAHHPSPSETRGSHHAMAQAHHHGSVYVTGGSSVTSASGSRSRLFTQETVISEHNEDSHPSPGLSTSTSLDKRHPDRPRERRSSPQPMYFAPFTYSQLVEATVKFQTSLGEGGFGVVYEGELPNGTKIAVKDLKLSNMSVADRERIQRSFEAEVQTLGLIHHVNLVRLLGYCTENDYHMLVYEFMANSSLDKWIFGDDPQRVLDWETRKRIAIGIARGLEYLHVGCSQAVIHLDVKPQNILLDDNLNPKLADFGIAKLLEMGEPLVTITLAQGTRAYMAPEIHQLGAVSSKTDVYSFGILLFEIIRGKRNGRELDDQDSKRFFPSWAREKFRRGRYLDAVHELKASLPLVPGFQIEEAKNLLCIAIACIHDDMDKRPDMKSVLLMLEGEKSVPSPPARIRDSISSNSHVRPR
ncbi:hypothetical protein KC19_12G020200 [Ceratodon purpureus]|uniref:Protein kinase domain-containing protein n=1 Tax=Ceratodon purpureus TaxID=3225 RepID=A0A8T0G3R9_CERPU|nr:hypothetical protein KC19_12G020200 [Ceratodon purpureus]